jgi:glucose-6-phosphate-specific signal transduction histidine kinase
MVSDSFKDDIAIQAIMSILKKANEPISTRKVGEEMQKLQLRCPDSTIVFLNRLRKRGHIRGKLSKEQRGWIWWVD